MDPQANITEQVETANKLYDMSIEGTDEYARLADRLADLVLSLDDWMTKGGTLPERWRPKEQVAEQALQACRVWMEDNDVQPSLVCRRLMEKALGPR